MAVATALKSFTAHCNFKSLVNHDAEQKAAAMHAQLLQWQHEMRMKDIERSLHSDDKAEMFDFYNALPKLELQKCELRRLQLENLKR
jgi:hypothetical protein